MNGAKPPRAGCREPAIGAVILAAGASSRMGCPKLLLPWGHSTVLGHVLAQWQALSEQVAVVIARGDNAAAAELDRLGHPVANRIVNENPQRGMFSSIQCASAWKQWNTELSHFAIALGDQPQLDAATTLTPLITAMRQNAGSVWQPSFHGAPKHPVILPRSLFLSLATASAQNLKEILSAQTVLLCPLDDPRLNLDLDYPADYERAFVQYGRAS